MEKQKNRVALHNLGCKVNAYETEAMGQLLREAGYMTVPFEEEADVYLVNTCSVTNMADRKSRQMLHRARKKNPKAVVVAAGCYVQAQAEEILKEGTADLIIGNNQKSRLVELLSQFLEKRQERLEAVIDIAHTEEYERLSIRQTTEHTRAFIKIQDGCNQFCSYCIIPYTRGRIRSRRPEDLLDEAKRLAGAGYQEVVLTGIHLSSYGKDFEQPISLLEILGRLEEVEGIRRIRLGSLEPRIVTEEFVAGLASMKQVCPHFHLSLQSGCDETLKRMNRHYTTADYAACCERLRKYYTDPAITTDIIVGFPGETEEEFLKTLSFLRQIGLSEMHIFKYSRRQGTKAAAMAGQVPEEVKTKRSHQAMLLEKEMARNFRQRFEGKQRELLLEEKQEIGGKRYLVGFTKEYVKAAVCMDRLDQREAALLVPGRMIPTTLLGETETEGRGLLLATPVSSFFDGFPAEQVRESEETGRKPLDSPVNLY
ncbi:MAG: tRNA (N(6)-L-threonylcarbamoyladenosine(37)-C(2))-methylthiotransferase MtaB [Lachnospiraceae bacterium]|nr:tRNA (N(6)-L-threonylcarbamoyladenosine(37)-C(2))-methylthiotransferase MtaB [Lachnospiraceae bacterium]